MKAKLHVPYYWRQGLEARVLEFNANFNNISAISWRPVLFVEETCVHGENHQPAASHWQTLSHSVVSSTPRHQRIWSRNVSSDRHWLHPTTTRLRPRRPRDDRRQSLILYIYRISTFYVHCRKILNLFVCALEISRKNELFCPVSTRVEMNVIFSVKLSEKRSNGVLWHPGLYCYRFFSSLNMNQVPTTVSWSVT
jgi:hypothetical protein